MWSGKRTETHTMYWNWDEVEETETKEDESNGLKVGDYQNMIDEYLNMESEVTVGTETEWQDQHQ